MACVLIASLVCDTLESKYEGITLKEMDRRLSQEVYQHYKKWCRERAAYVTACSHRFSLARFGKDTWNAYPELGSIFKAAVVKTMLYWCLDYLRGQQHTPRGDRRAQTMYYFTHFQFLMDTRGPFLSNDVARKVVQTARDGLVAYQRLASNDRKREDGRRTLNHTEVPCHVGADHIHRRDQAQSKVSQIRIAPKFSCLLTGAPSQVKNLDSQ